MRAARALVFATAFVLAACASDAAQEVPVTAAEQSEPSTDPAEPTAVPAAVVDEPDRETVKAAPSADVAENDGLYPDVVGATATSTDGMIWRFDVTLSSPYDAPERYADAWRVLDIDDNELGIRVLGHDHANEQPFTRSLGGVEIDPGVTVVFIEGRDQLNGWSGERFELEVSR